MHAITYITIWKAKGKNIDTHTHTHIDTHTRTHIHTLLNATEILCTGRTQKYFLLLLLFLGRVADLLSPWLQPMETLLIF